MENKNRMPVSICMSLCVIWLAQGIFVWENLSSSCFLQQISLVQHGSLPAACLEAVSWEFRVTLMSQHLPLAIKFKLIHTKKGGQFLYAKV